MRTKLPVIESCDGCGACCMEMGFPVGYGSLIANDYWLLSKDQIRERVEHGSSRAWKEFGRDIRRFNRMPEELRDELLERFYLMETRDWDGPCFWLD